MPSLSYAEALGAHQGTKRTVSDRVSVSPSDVVPKRVAKYSIITGVCDESPSSEIHPADLSATPSIEEDLHHSKGTPVCAQRRLFSPQDCEQPIPKKTRCVIEKIMKYIQCNN